MTTGPSTCSDWNTIVFNFFGGERHGQSVRADRSSDLFEVVNYWTATAGGTVGRQFDVPSPNAAPVHRYQIKSKRVAGGEIHFNCDHVDCACG
jgi:hypothetical protein